MMRGLRVRPFTPEDFGGWDQFVASSLNGTFLHTRRFLSYHGARFEDASLLVEDERGRILAVLPAALDPENADVVVTHPGITCGGLVHDGALRGTALLEAMRGAVEIYRARGVSSLCYKAVPHAYHRSPAADDLYALFQLGAQRYRCDLAAVIALSHRQPPSKRRLRCLSKAEKFGVEVAEGGAFLKSLWPVLEENLEIKHNAKPVHSLQEIERIQSLFPQHVRCVVGLHHGTVVAGVVLFHLNYSVRAQYIASNRQGHEVFALDKVFDTCICQSTRAGLSYFDFGTSNDPQSGLLNDGLYGFKTEFGAGSVQHDHYRLNLR
jgi:hypothetical protein